MHATRPWLCCKLKIKNIFYDASEYLMMSLFSTSPHHRVFYRTNYSLSMWRWHLVKWVEYRGVFMSDVWPFHITWAQVDSVYNILRSSVRCSNICVISAVPSFRCSFAFVIIWNSLKRVCWCLIVARVWVRVYTWGGWEIVWVFRWTIELLVSGHKSVVSFFTLH